MKLSPTKFYSVDELCALLRIKKGTAWHWANDRKFTTVKVMGKLLFDADEINQHIEMNTRSSDKVLAQKAIQAVSK